MESKTRAIVVLVLTMGLMAGCSTGPVPKEEGNELLKSAQSARQEWNKEDPQFEAFAKKGYGYAFFPEITKGGLLVGGARGRGVVHEKGQPHRLRGLNPGISRFSSRTTASLLCSEPGGDGQIQTK